MRIGRSSSFEDAKHTHADRVKLIAHEMYHVISRFDPSLRKRTHEAVGCVYKGLPLTIDEQTRSIIITNPDAHEFACALRVTLKSGGKKWVMPETVLKVTNGVTPTFADITTKLLLVDAPGAQWQVLRGSDGKAQFIETSTTNYDQIMNINTDYNIHAEEVVAENFPLMLTEKAAGVNKTGTSTSLNRPEFIKKLKAILERLWGRQGLFGNHAGIPSFDDCECPLPSALCAQPRVQISKHFSKCLIIEISADAPAHRLLDAFERGQV